MTRDGRLRISPKLTRVTPSLSSKKMFGPKSDCTFRPGERSDGAFISSRPAEKNNVSFPPFGSRNSMVGPEPRLSLPSILCRWLPMFIGPIETMTGQYSPVNSLASRDPYCWFVGVHSESNPGKPRRADCKPLPTMRISQYELLSLHCAARSPLTHCHYGDR